MLIDVKSFLKHVTQALLSFSDGEYSYLAHVMLITRFQITDIIIRVKGQGNIYLNLFDSS